MAFDPRRIHHVCIGYDKSAVQERINVDLIRGMSFGNELWLTIVYNSDPNLVPSGIGENTFILQSGSRGYAYGALDAINAGVDFALCHNRDIIVVHNFDCLFFDEQKYKFCIEDFLESGLDISSAPIIHGIPATDLFIMKADYARKLFPLTDKHAKYRENIKALAHEYKPTELGYSNVEEWLWENMIEVAGKTWPPSMDIVGIQPLDPKNPMLNELGHDWTARDVEIKMYMKKNIWHHMARTDLPWLRWSDKLAFGHMHDYGEIKAKLLEHGRTEGGAIQQFLDNVQ